LEIPIERAGDSAVIRFGVNEDLRAPLRQEKKLPYFIVSDSDGTGDKGENGEGMNWVDDWNGLEAPGWEAGLTVHGKRCRDAAGGAVE
jgi:hypothetical protein